MEKKRIIKFNRHLISHEELGIMIDSIIDKLPMNESKIKFTPYKTGLWKIIDETFNTLEKDEELAVVEEEDKN